MSYGQLYHRLLTLRLSNRRLDFRSASGTAQNAGRRLKKILLYTTSATTVSLIGSVGYAYVDPHFRKSFESNVPGASYVFSNLFGSSSETSLFRSSEINSSHGGMPKPSRARSEPPTFLPASAQVEGTTNSIGHSNQLKDREEVVKLVDEILDKKLSALTSAQKKELTEKVQMARSEFEEELRKELAKQNSTHALHEEQMLRSQRESLLVEHKKEVQEVLLKERQEYMNKLSKAIAQLTALEVFLNGRSEFDSQNRRAKKLWISCQQLKNMLCKKSLHEDQISAGHFTLINLADVINDIKEASESDDFIKSLLKFVPGQVIGNGVYCEDDLMKRYEKVKLLCRRLARVVDKDTSLFRYILSYLQSLLIWDNEKVTLADSQIDPKEASVHEILSRTSYCLKKKDYESAIRLMSVLKGEPARAASDWIADLRTHAEMVQLSNLMIAHASAQSIRSLY